MKTTIFTVMMMFAVTCLNAQEISLIDPQVLGQPADQAVKFLLPANAKAIEPITIQVDITNGKYSGAMGRYGSKITLEEACENLNKKYKKYEQTSFANNRQMCVWRITDEKFAIQAVNNEDGTTILYLPFKYREAKPE